MAAGARLCACLPFLSSALLVPVEIAEGQKCRAKRKKERNCWFSQSESRLQELPRAHLFCFWLVGVTCCSKSRRTRSFLTGFHFGGIN